MAQLSLQSLNNLQKVLDCLVERGEFNQLIPHQCSLSISYETSENSIFFKFLVEMEKKIWLEMG